MRRKSFWVFGIVTSLALGAAGHAAKGGGKIPLRGTFRDAPGDALTPQDRILSDARGDYVDQENGIDHHIQGDGGYRLGVNTEGLTGNRAVFFDFRQCAAPVGECTPPFSVPTAVGRIGLSTDNRVGGLTAPISDLSAQWIFSAADPDGKDKTWFVRFRTFDAEHDCTGSSGIVARHPDANTWEIEAEPGDIACLQAQPKQCPKCPREYHGKYNLPFKITSMRK